ASPSCRPWASRGPTRRPRSSRHPSNRSDPAWHDAGREQEVRSVTYSIVDRDAATGQLGVAVQTCMFAVGSVVPWARAGVGAVASQAIAESAYGPRCLDAMAEGATAALALDAAMDADPMSAMRQVGVVAADG